MFWVWYLRKNPTKKKVLSIKCGNDECTPRVYEDFYNYIVIYNHNKWWFRVEYPLLCGFTDNDVKQIKAMAQYDYDMYCERNEVSNG